MVYFKQMRVSDGEMLVYDGEISWAGEPANFLAAPAPDFFFTGSFS